MGGINTSDFFKKYRSGKLREITGREPISTDEQQGATPVETDAGLEIKPGVKYRVKGDTVEEIDASGNVVGVRDAAFKAMLEERMRAGKAKKINADAPMAEEPRQDPEKIGITPQFRSAQAEVQGSDYQRITNALKQARQDVGGDNPVSLEGKVAIQQEIKANQDIVGNDILDLYESLPDFAQGQLRSLGVDKEEFTRKLLNETEGADELKKYAGIRMQALEAEKQSEIAAQNFKTRPGKMPFDVSFETVQAEGAKRKEIDDKYAAKAASIKNSIGNLAMIKAVNTEVYEGGKRPEEVDPYEVGLKVLEVTHPQMVDKYRKKSEQGIISPSERYAIGFAGNQAMQLAGMNMIAKGDEANGNQLLAKTEGFTRRLLDENPEFKKEQLQYVLANDIYQDKQTLWSQITGTSVSKEDITEAAKRLGIPESEVADIKPEDLKRQPNAFANIINSAIRTGAAPVEEWWTRHFINPVNEYIDPKNYLTDEQLDERFKEGWYDNTWLGRMFDGGVVESATTMDRRIVGKDYGTQEFLTDIGVEKGKFNLNSVANMMLEGTGQIAGLAAGAKGLSRLSGLSMATANMTHMYITGYDRNKRMASQYIQGDTDADEAKRIALANIYTGAEVLAERALLPIEKMNIWNSNAGRKLIDQVQKGGLESVKRGTVVDFGKDVVYQTAKESGKEGLEESATVYGQALGDMFFAPERFATANYNQEAVEAGITGAISSLIPTGAGGLRHALQKGPMRNAVMYEVGVNPSRYITEITKERESGKISERDATEKITAINKIADIVQKRVPEQSPATGRELDQEDKVAYANNLLDEELLTEQKEVAKDEVQSQVIDGLIEQNRAERAEILNKKPLEESVGVGVEAFMEEYTPVPAQTTTTSEAQQASVQSQQPTVSAAQISAPVSTSSATTPVTPSVSTEEFFSITDENEIAESAKVGENIKQAFASEPKIVGRDFTTTLPSGEKMKGKYVLTDAFAITPSHNPNTFSSNEGIPLLDGGRNPNDRDYTQPTNQKAVTARANDYDGRAITNTPIVDKNGVVISGNDRTMSGQLAAQNQTDGKYIEALKENAEFYGFTSAQVDQMISEGKHPRIVFVPDTVLPYTTETYAKFNVSEGKEKSRLEDVITKARTLDTAFTDAVGRDLMDFDTLSDFYADKASVKTVASRMSQAGLLTPDNTARYYNDRSGFTDEGKKMLSNVLLSSMLTEEALFTIQEYPALIDKITQNLVTIAGIEATGLLPIKEGLSNAVLLYHDVDQFMRKTKMPMADKLNGLESYRQQQDLFTDKDIIEDNLYVELIRPPKQFKEYLRSVKSRADNYASNPGGDLFSTEPVSVRKILDEAQLLIQQLKQEQQTQTQSQQQEVQNEPTEINAGTPEREPTGEDIVSQPPAGSVETTDRGVQEVTEQPAEQKEGQAGDVVTEATAVTQETTPRIAAETPYVSLLAGVSENDFLVEEHQRTLEEKQRKTPEEKGLDDAIADFNKYLGFIDSKERKMADLDKAGKRSSKEYVDAFAARKMYVQKMQAAQKKVNELTKKINRQKADKIREAKIETQPDGNLYAADPFSALLLAAKVVGTKIINASIEIVATSIELGYDLRSAIQKGVDYINEHYGKKWPEPEYRSALGENGGNPALVRAMRVIETTLTEKQQAAAEAIVSGVLDGRTDMDSVMASVNGWIALPESTRSEIISYVNRRVEGENMRKEASERAKKIREEERTAEQQVEDKIQEEISDNARVDTGTPGYDFLRNFTLRTDDETRRFVSGKTIADIYGEVPEGEQDYHVAKITDMLDDGERMVDAAKLQFGDDILVYGPKLLHYVKNDMVDDTAKKAVLTATFIGKLQDAKLREPARARQINMLLQQTYSYWQQFIRDKALALNAARILRMYRDKQMADFYTDRIFNEAQRKAKQRMEKAKGETSIPDEIAEKGATNKDSAESIATEAKARAERKPRKQKAKKVDNEEYKQKLADLKRKHGDTKTVFGKLKDIVNKIKC